METATNETANSPQTKLIKEPTAVLRMLGKPEILTEAGDALPLLLMILSKCAITQSGNCDLVLSEVARSLGRAPATITSWHHQLRDRGLVSSRRKKGRVNFEPMPQFALEASAQSNMVLPKIAGEVKDLQSAVLVDLLARIRMLERNGTISGHEVA